MSRRRPILYPLIPGCRCASRKHQGFRSRLVADAFGAPVLRDQGRSTGRARQVRSWRPGAGTGQNLRRKLPTRSGLPVESGGPEPLLPADGTCCLSVRAGTLRTSSCRGRADLAQGWGRRFDSGGCSTPESQVRPANARRTLTSGPVQARRGPPTCAQRYVRALSLSSGSAGAARQEYGLSDRTCPDEHQPCSWCCADPQSGG